MRAAAISARILRMADVAAQFFEGLAARGHEPALAHASGTVRFELLDGKRAERWLVEVRKGNITVSHRNASADCVVRGDRSLFGRIVSGQENATAALLRGAVEVEGEVGLIVLFQKLIPGPEKTRPRATGAKRRKR